MELDPNATPICARYIERADGFSYSARVLSESHALSLERRARIAEEKLRIALSELERQAANCSDRYEAKLALEEIEKVGK